MKVRARFDDLSELKRLFAKDFPVIGIGVTAFPRSALGYLLPNYKILCLLETKDLKAIEHLSTVVSLEKDLKAKFPEKFNTSEILQLSQVKKWLMENGKGLFLYKASTRSSRLAKEMGLKVLSTPGEIRKVFENKKEFRVEGKKAGINLVKGETLLVDDLDENKWEEFKQKLGERLVFQLPDYTVGGGLGTFFINNKQDFDEFKEFVIKRREVREINIVNVTKYISGKSASITGCSTHYGTVTSVLQTQVIDQPELAALYGRSGVWLGHDWYVGFSDKEQMAAEEQCKKWGEYIYKKGYKGIFGLDVIVDEEGKVWPIECNSRYTGAFPVYTMMQVAQKEMPIDVWHLLEWLGIEYEMDIEKVQEVSRQSKKGAHLILHNIERKFVMVTGNVKAGVYRISTRQDKHDSSFQVNFSSDFVARKIAAESGNSFKQKLIKIEWVREGFSLLDIKEKNEVVLCDKVVGQYTVLKPAERVGRLMFKRRVLDKKGRLLPEIREIIKAIYSQFELMSVEKPEGY